MGHAVNSNGHDSIGTHLETDRASVADPITEAANSSPDVRRRSGTSFVLADRRVLDQVRGCQLATWDDTTVVVRGSFEYDGLFYSPIPLDRSMEDALHLPASVVDHGTVEELVSALQSIIKVYGPFDDSASLLLALFVLATWVSDAVPGAPCLNLCGTLAANHPLVDLLVCLCRRPVRLMQPSWRELGNLPPGLLPTVILKHCNTHVVTSFFNAVSGRDEVLLPGGRCRSLRCALIACTAAPVRFPCLSLSLCLSDAAFCQRLLSRDAQELADRYQPRLLSYRLRHYGAVANASFDVPSFAISSRLVARWLGAAVEGSPSLQADLVNGLKGHDEHAKIDESQTPSAVVLEALLVLVHEKKPAAYVAEVTELANGILRGRHGDTPLSAKTVGSIMRIELGLQMQRHSAGYELRLTSQTVAHLHSLAATHNVLTLLKPNGACDICRAGAGRDRLRPDSQHDHKLPDRGTSDVHDVHQVHDVPAPTEIE